MSNARQRAVVDTVGGVDIIEETPAQWLQDKGQSWVEVYVDDVGEIGARYDDHQERLAQARTVAASAEALRLLHELVIDGMTVENIRKAEQLLAEVKG